MCSNRWFFVIEVIDPHRHNQWHRAVLPPCMAAYVASSMCPSFLLLQVDPACEQLPWLQQYFGGPLAFPRPLLPPRSLLLWRSLRPPPEPRPLPDESLMLVCRVEMVDASACICSTMVVFGVLMVELAAACAVDISSASISASRCAVSRSTTWSMMVVAFASS